MLYYKTNRIEGKKAIYRTYIKSHKKKKMAKGSEKHDQLAN